jgi:hypothetical protein
LCGAVLLLPRKHPAWWDAATAVGVAAVAVVVALTAAANA